MKWLTWEQVGVDRMACAWLITKYIDPEAEFLFVPAGQKPLPGSSSCFVRIALDTTEGEHPNEVDYP